QLCHARQLVESAHTHVSSFLPIPSRIARPIWRVILLGSKNDACARCPRPRTLSERPTRQWSGRVTVARGHGCRAGSGATIRVVAEDLDPLLERFASTLRLAQSALEEAREMSELLGDIDQRFDVRKAVDGAARLVDNVLASVDRAREG